MVIGVTEGLDMSRALSINLIKEHNYIYNYKNSFEYYHFNQTFTTQFLMLFISGVMFFLSLVTGFQGFPRKAVNTRSCFRFMQDEDELMAGLPALARILLRSKDETLRRMDQTLTSKDET